jgi:hypothetical protein
MKEIAVIYWFEGHLVVLIATVYTMARARVITSLPHDAFDAA